MRARLPSVEIIGRSGFVLLNGLRPREGEKTYFTRLPPGRLITCHTSRGVIVELYLLDGAA